MPKMVRIRNVPDEVHREVKARAASAGMSLSDYLLREVERIVSLPPVEDLPARLASLPETELSESPVEAVRAIRGG